MSVYKLSVSTPDGLKFEGDVVSVVVRTVAGDVCILKNHSDFVSAIEVGRATITTEEKTLVASCIGGFISVCKGELSIVATTFEFAEDIDLIRAEKARERAERIISEKRSDAELKIAEAKLKRALNRIFVAKNK